MPQIQITLFVKRSEFQTRETGDMSDSWSKNKKPMLLRFLTLILGQLRPSSCSFDSENDVSLILAPTRNQEAVETEEKMEGKEFPAMKRSVKQLHFGGSEEKSEAAVEIKNLAKVGPTTRRRLAELGVIPSLVAMLDLSSLKEDSSLVAVDALVELANGDFTNKVLIVEAGFLAKLPRLMATRDLSRKHELVFLLLSISSLAKTQFPISSCNILSIIIEILTANETVDDIKLASLAALHNLSTKIANTKTIVSTGVVNTLLILALDKKASEGALATLGNLVPTKTGKKAIEDDTLAPKIFVEILTWHDKPRCQELAGYVLMVLAHQSKTQRLKMNGIGIVPVLLEVALLGSPLAQKRALKILQWFKSQGRAPMRIHSGPQVERGASPSSTIGEEDAKKYREAIKEMVRQSLDNNMELIMRRANASKHFSRNKNLLVSPRSKSLPY